MSPPVTESGRGRQRERTLPNHSIANARGWLGRLDQAPRPCRRRGPFASEDGVERLLRDGGLTGVRTAHRLVEAAFRDAEHLLEFSWSHGQRAMWESVPEHELPALRQRMLEMARGFADPSGGFSFTQQVRYTLGHRPSPSTGA
jgi:hypothetical protein